MLHECHILGTISRFSTGYLAMCSSHPFYMNTSEKQALNICAIMKSMAFEHNCISEAPDTLQQHSQFTTWYYLFCPNQSAEFKVHII